MKKAGLILVALVLSTLLVGLVSAQITGTPGTKIGQGFVKFIEETVNTINPIAKYLLGDTQATATFSAGTLLFAKILFFLLILSVIYLSLSTVDFFNYKAWALWVVAIGAAILATRFLGNLIVPAVLIPYSALGMFISAGIPFFLAFIVIERGMAGPANAYLRKVAWIFFAVIFLGLWITRGTGNKAAYIYPITALICFIMMILDGTIQGFFNNMAFAKASAMRRGPALQSIENLINGVHTNFGNLGAAYIQTYPANPAVTGVQAYKNDIRELENRRKTLLRNP